MAKKTAKDLADQDRRQARANKENRRAEKRHKAQKDKPLKNPMSFKF